MASSSEEGQENNDNKKAQFTIVLKQPPSNTEAIHTAALHMANLEPEQRRYQERSRFAKDFGYWTTSIQHSLAEIGISQDDVLSMDQSAGLVVLNTDTEKMENIFPWDGRDYTIPEQLRETVQSVHGPRQQIRFRHHINLHDTLQPHSVFANQLQTYYGMPAPTDATGKGQCIGIIELGGGFNASDLTSYWTKSSIKFTGSVIAVSVDGTPNAPGKDVDSDAEVALDIQIAASIATASKIVVYFAANTEQGFIQAVNYAVHDSKNNPGIISISWGGPEKGWSAGGLQSFSGACQAAGLLGVSILVASGDDGSADGSTGVNCDFPASSPWVLACGGTSLTQSTETAWTPHSGGGVSSTFPVPQYQQSAKIPVTPAGSPKVGFAGRGVPDVAACGDPNSGYTVVVDGQVYRGIGGTSCVAPLLSGLLALCNEVNKKNVGFVNTLLYQNPTALKQITSGNNGFWQCGLGWNAVCGLGSPTAQLVTVFAGGGTTGGGGTGGGTVTVADQNLTTNENVPLNISLSAMTTAPGATIASVDAGNPTHGAVAWSSATANSVSGIYTPNQDFVGMDAFTYTAKDSAGNVSNTGTITIKMKLVTPTAARYQLRSQASGATTWSIVYDSNPAGGP